VILVVMFIAGWNLLRGRVGRAMVAIRDHPIAADAMVWNSAMFKTLTFA
jgi:branched-chain amino acid transport system permease protein